MPLFFAGHVSCRHVPQLTTDQVLLNSRSALVRKRDADDSGLRIDQSPDLQIILCVKREEDNGNVNLTHINNL